VNRTEACAVARDELDAIERAGYGLASEHVDTVILKDISTADGNNYEVELSYLWKDEECEQILVICKITAKDWFRHEQLQESIILGSDA